MYDSRTMTYDFTMSHDDRMTVLRWSCTTSYDPRWSRTTSSHDHCTNYWVWCRVTSYDFLRSSYDHLRWVILGWLRTIGVNRATLHDVVRRRSHRGPISRCIAILVHTIFVYDVTYDIVRRRGSSHDICAIDVRWRHTTSSVIVRRRKTQSKIERHRTTVMRSSYEHRATNYKAILASHHAIIVTSYVIVRLSFDCRTMSYDVIRCSTISQRLSMCRKPIVSGVTTKQRMQYHSRIGEYLRNLRCDPSHDVAARCDQGLNGRRDH